MRAAYILDQFADPSGCNEEQLQKMTWKSTPQGPVAIFPAGTVVEGDEAILRCRCGIAMPLDDECKAATGLTDSQLRALQLQNQMAMLGINDKADQELFKAGVIAGYDDKLEYIPGPQWEAYQKAKAATEQADDIE